jgi:hypothetical protein
VRRGGLFAVASVVTVALILGGVGNARADDDDDDDDDSGRRSSSVEMWPPTEVSWPPLSAPTSTPAPPVIPLP